MGAPGASIRKVKLALNEKNRAGFPTLHSRLVMPPEAILLWSFGGNGCRACSNTTGRSRPSLDPRNKSEGMQAQGEVVFVLVLKASSRVRPFARRY